MLPGSSSFLPSSFPPLPSSFASLTSFAPSLQYALFNPGRGSESRSPFFPASFSSSSSSFPVPSSFPSGIWYLTGMAMRQCIEFGYHHETPSASQVSPLEVDMKRRLFWMAYKVSSSFDASTSLPSSSRSTLNLFRLRLAARSATLLQPWSTTYDRR